MKSLVAVIIYKVISSQMLKFVFAFELKNEIRSCSVHCKHLDLNVCLSLCISDQRCHFSYTLHEFLCFCSVDDLAGNAFRQFCRSCVEFS